MSVVPQSAHFASSALEALQEQSNEIDLTNTSFAALYQVLLDGNDFVKFGRRGDPHSRRVSCSKHGTLRWGPTYSNPAEPKPPKSFLRLKDVSAVVKGKHSRNFARSVAKSAPDHLCFTVTTPTRTLDLQAPSTAVRDLWVEAITDTVLFLKQIANGNSVFSPSEIGARSADSSEDEVEPASVVDGTGTEGGHDAETGVDRDDEKVFEVTDPPQSTPNAGGAGHKKPSADKKNGKARRSLTAGTMPSLGTPTGTADPTTPRGTLTDSILKLPTPTMTEDEIAGVQMLEKGDCFVKHGRSGEPRIKRVYVSKGRLLWLPVHSRSKEPADSLSLIKIKRIIPGKGIAQFQRGIAKQVPAGSCFSLVTQDRTLALQARNEEMRDRWVAALTVAARKAQEISNAKFLAVQKYNNETYTRTFSKSDMARLMSLPGSRTSAGGSVSGSGTLNGTTASSLADQAASNSSLDVRSHTWTADDIAKMEADAKNPPSAELERARQEFYAELAGQDLTFDQIKMLSFLDAGEELIKFGRHGSPKAKWVNVTRGRLFWVPSILGRTPSNSKAPTFIMLVDVKGVVAGKVTHVFKRPVAKGIPQANCFSVITDYRTLDFQALNEDQRDFWIDALRFAVKRTQNEVHRQWLAKQRIAAEDPRNLDAKALAPFQVKPSIDLVTGRKEPSDAAARVHRSNTWSGRDHEALLATKFVLNWVTGKSVEKNISRDPASRGHSLLSTVSMHENSVSSDAPESHASYRSNRSYNANSFSWASHAVGLVERVPINNGRNSLKRSQSLITPANAQAVVGGASATQNGSAGPDHFAIRPKRSKSRLSIASLFSSDDDAASESASVNDGDGAPALQRSQSDDTVGSRSASARVGPPLPPRPVTGVVSTKLTVDIPFNDGAVDGPASALSTPASNSLASPSAGVITSGGSAAAVGSEAQRQQLEDELDREALELAQAEAEAEAEAMLALQRIKKQREKEDEDKKKRAAGSGTAAGAGSAGPPGAMPPPVPAKPASLTSKPPVPPKPASPSRAAQLHLAGDAIGGSTDASSNDGKSAVLHSHPPSLDKDRPRAAVTTTVAAGPAAAPAAASSRKADLSTSSGTASAAALAASIVNSGPRTFDPSRDSAGSGDDAARRGSRAAGGGRAGNGSYDQEEEDDEYERGGVTETEAENTDAPAELSTIEEETRTDVETTDAEATHTEADTDHERGDDDDRDEDAEARTRQNTRSNRGAGALLTPAGAVIGTEAAAAAGAVDDAEDVADDPPYIDEPVADEEYQESKTFSKVSTVKLSKQQIESLTKELRRCLHSLGSTSASWQNRAKAMQRIEELVLKENITALPRFWNHMEALQICLAQQVEDLRSSIVKDACHLLMVLAQACGTTPEWVDSFMIKILPSLFKRLYVTIKIMSQSADECIRSMISASQAFAPRAISVFLHSAMSDTHGMVRARCAEYLAQILTECKDDPAVDDYILELAGVIGRNINDGDNNARAATRQLFLAFEYLWPQAASRLFEKFSALTVRIINQERRRAATPAGLPPTPTPGGSPPKKATTTPTKP